MFISMKSRSNLKLGNWVKKYVTRSNLRKPCIHSGRYSFDPMLMNLCQNVCHHEKRTNFKMGHVGSKTRSLGHIKKYVYTLEGIVLIQSA